MTGEDTRTPRGGYERVPVNRHFGFRLLSRDVEGAVVSMDPLPAYLQEEGVVQGGIVAALADNAAVYAFLPDTGEGEVMTGVEFKVNFLRPALPENGPLVARSRVVRRGRRIGVCDVEVVQGDRPVARGLFTYLFMKRDG
jgi:uncharacterized protein (TIGR00369 family)